jgi:hypothetical protein
MKNEVRTEGEPNRGTKAWSKMLDKKLGMRSRAP